ncbi:SMP-30/gluconolactonase/LRE family protein [Leifsonia sp. H3M29-4]|uniref:SMP-30/gluconolactonase/LRE family protein n=1 Tax=Salinibacterium metalliresistens TaxID=3031321 RepID=UPI0023DC8691|nr:SMP-30/gluconolactonase/LRE family protein [Salinibacterium metalliresistens]MDF1479215.1 SMP-30/gluconolactonase/LRE family protein [Salinibacterium metalliresistens]
MALHTGVAATEATYDLAEGVIWDEERALVRWVDIWKGRVLAGELADDRLTVVEDIALGQTVGAVALAEDGGLLVAASRGLATISPGGVISFGPDLLGDRSDVRLNDGAADMFGAFVVGSLTIGGDTGEERLLRVFPNSRVEVLREGVRLSNGIAFSPDGGTIYHVDTFAKTVSKHSYGFGPFDSREPWVTVLDENDLPAYPDGLTVDAQGMLWVAQFGGSNIRRHAPNGDLLDIVMVDAGQVTCSGFVGPKLDRLAITSGQENLATITDQTGAIFLAYVDATGLRAPRWTGSTTTPYWLLPQRDEQ